MWSPSYEARAARMREQAEPPMPRMRRNRKRDADLHKYAELYADVNLRLTNLTSTLNPGTTFTVYSVYAG